MSGIKISENSMICISLCADAAYDANKRYSPVKLVSGKDGVFTVATDVTDADIIGVLQTETKAGEAGRIAIGGMTYLKASAALTAGAKVGTWGVVIGGAAKDAVAAVLIRPSAAAASN